MPVQLTDDQARAIRLISAAQAVSSAEFIDSAINRAIGLSLEEQPFIREVLKLTAA